MYTGFPRWLAFPRKFALGLVLLAALTLSATAEGKSGPAKKKKNIPLVVSEPKRDQTIQTAPQPAQPAQPTTAFEELNFNKTLVIEGKVEKPQVQFTLLKEAPPEKEIRFETSFLQNILKLDRENTFKVGETYGKE